MMERAPSASMDLSSFARRLWRTSTTPSSSTEKSSTEAVSSIVGDVPATNLCRYCFLADLTSAYEDRAYLVQLLLQLQTGLNY